MAGAQERRKQIAGFYQEVARKAAGAAKRAALEKQALLEKKAALYDRQVRVLGLVRKMVDNRSISPEEIFDKIAELMDPSTDLELEAKREDERLHDLGFPAHDTDFVSTRGRMPYRDENGNTGFDCWVMGTSGAVVGSGGDVYA